MLRICRKCLVYSPLRDAAILKDAIIAVIAPSVAPVVTVNRIQIIEPRTKRLKFCLSDSIREIATLKNEMSLQYVHLVPVGDKSALVEVVT